MRVIIIMCVSIILLVFTPIIQPSVTHAQTPINQPVESSANNPLFILFNLFGSMFQAPQIPDANFDIPLDPSSSQSASLTPTIFQTQQYTGTSGLLPDPLPPISTKALKYQTNTTPCIANQNVYEEASSKTQIPWYVFAAIHYNEGGCRKSGSLVSGREIGANEPDIVRAGGCSSGRTGPGIPTPLPSGGCGFSTLLDSAIYAGNHLKGKIGKVPETFEEIVKAFSRYNGGGNRNCERTPYTNCPRQFYGEDDPYAMNYFDAKHEAMYLVYCADSTPCNPPRNYPRPGAVTFMRLIANQL